MNRHKVKKGKYIKLINEELANKQKNYYDNKNILYTVKIEDNGVDYIKGFRCYVDEQRLPKEDEPSIFKDTIVETSKKYYCPEIEFSGDEYIINNAQEDNKGILNIKVETLSKYCDVVDFFTHRWREKVKERRESHPPEADFFPGELSPWFRGITRQNYELEPTLLRKTHENFLSELEGSEEVRIRTIEGYLLRRFKTFSDPFLQKLPREDIEWFFLMQHHGLPTRLLDWSKSSFIALFFAIKSFQDKEKEILELEKKINNSDTFIEKAPDAAVWMLEPRRLSEKCTTDPTHTQDHGNRSIYGANDKDKDIIAPYFPPLDELRRNNSAYDTMDLNMVPLPLIPNIVTPRIGSQIGRFTLHTQKKDALVEFARSLRSEDWYLIKIIIPIEKHRDIIRSLRVAGISHMNIRQELDSIADELTWRMNLGLSDRQRGY